MSAIEQPAPRSGRITFWSPGFRMSADSAMKWTPQKTMYSASGRSDASLASLKESPVTSAWRDHVVALVVVAEDDEARAQLAPRRLDALVQLGLRHPEVVFERGACAESTTSTVSNAVVIFSPLCSGQPAGGLNAARAKREI